MAEVTRLDLIFATRIVALLPSHEIDLMISKTYESLPENKNSKICVHEREEENIIRHNINKKSD
jgi:hypothetical protein